MKPRRARATIMAREVRVSSLALHVSTRADKPRGGVPTVESGSWLEVTGEIDKPVREVGTMAVTVLPMVSEEPGASVPPSIGSIIQVRPTLTAVVSVPVADFDRVWSMAISGHLNYVHVVFTEPDRRSALIVSVAFSNKSENDEPESPSPPDAQASPTTEHG